MWTVEEQRGILAPFVPRLLQGPRGAEGPGHWCTEGTLVVADLSGFTRLTEKLSRQGRAGAEEILTTVSAVFGALLSVVEPGGDVLKLSGDALVIFFASEGHGERACRTALAMQRMLRQVGGIDSSRGRVRLRMSVGVHSGRFQFLLCGTEHLELLIVGQAATGAVTAEASAGPGQVLATSATAGVLGPEAGLAEVSRGWLVRSVPSPRSPGPAADTGDHALERFVPPVLRERLRGGLEEGEHRRATLAFVRCGGLDGPATRRDELFERYQELTAGIMAACAAHGGVVLATDVAAEGPAFMLAAGVPTGSGDDEARMLRLAHHIVELDAGVAVRVGINTGGVFVGAVGAPERWTYTAMGDATNLAARLAGSAGWGEILASAETTAGVDGRFVLEPVPALTVKGKRLPVEAVRLLRPVTPRPAHAVREDVPLVGRGAELERLLEALEAARSGHGRVIELVGARGTGKSRLVGELRRLSGDVRWLTIACEPYDSAIPFHTARVLLRRFVGLGDSSTPQEAGEALRRIVAGRAPGLLPLLPLLAVPAGAALAPTPESEQVAPQFRAGRAAEVAGQLLAAIGDEPAVVVIEGVEHIDESSAEIVAAVLTAAVPTNPWLVVLTCEDPGCGGHAGEGTVITLDPLSVEDTALLAAHLADRIPVPAHELAGLASRSAGNPLLLREMVRARAEGGLPELPPTIESLMAARIDALAPPDRRALRYVAVLGQRFDAGLLDATLGDLGIDSGRDELWRRLEGFLLRSGDGFAFRHELARQTAYEALPVSRRRELHGRVADALSSHPGTAASRLALHYARAGRWDEAWRAAVEGAGEAARAGANASAGQLYELALEAAGHVELPPADIARVAVEAGDAAVLAGLYGAAVQALEVARSTVTDPVERLLLAVRRGEIDLEQGRTTTALRRYGRALSEAAALPPGPDRQRCLGRLHAGYAAARLRQGRLGSCIRHCQEAVAAAAGADDDSLARALHLLDVAHSARGDRRAAAAARDRALPVYVRLGDLPAQATVLYDLAVDARTAGRLEEAQWLFERSADTRRRAGDVIGAALADCGLAGVLADTGGLAAAEQLLVEARRVLRGAGNPGGTAVAERGLGVVALRSGAGGTAIDHLVVAVAGFTELGDGAGAARAQRLLAEALLAEDRCVEAWEAATASLERMGEQATVGDRLAAGRVRGEALLRTGGVERARGELQAMLELAEEHGREAEAEALRRLLGGEVSAGVTA